MLVLDALFDHIQQILSDVEIIEVCLETIERCPATSGIAI